MLATLDDLPRQVDAVTGSRALEAASTSVQAACGWPIQRTTSTYRGRLGHANSIWLPTLRLLAVTGVTVDGVAVTGVDFLPSGEVFFTGYRPRGMVLQFTYDHGYDVIPAPVRDVTVDVAVARLATPDAPMPIRSEREGIGSYTRELTYVSGTSPVTDHRLDVYRLIGGVA